MRRIRILVADDDYKTVQSIKEIFAKDEDVMVIASSNADLAIEIVWRDTPDVLIVNRTLPDLSGWEVLGILRKNEPTRLIPFIMLNDRPSGPNDEVRALDLGADDYINKPFNPEILRARTMAVLRRFLYYKPEHAPREILKSSNIILDMAAHVAYIDDKPIDLTPKEFSLLYLLMKRKNQVVNRVFLSESIWEHEYFATSHTIEKHIANLRKKLGPESKRIETLPTIGYKFIEEEEY